MERTVQRELIELVKRAQSGDAAAFEELYRRTAQAQYFTILGRVGEVAAQDILQEAYLVAWKNIDQIRPGAFIGYLSATARNLCLEHYRAQASKPVSMEQDALAATAEENRAAGRTDECGRSDIADPARLAVGAERVAHLAQVLREDLDDRQREAVMLRYYQGMRVADVADEMGVSRATVYNLLRRATNILRQKLGVLPAGFAFTDAIARAVELQPVAGAHPCASRVHRASAGQWASRVAAALTAAAVVGVVSVAATWKEEPASVTLEPMPVPQAAPAGVPEADPGDTDGPQLVDAAVVGQQLVLEVRDGSGVRAVWCVGADGARYDADLVEAADPGASEHWWFTVPSGTYEVHLVDAAGNEVLGTATANIIPATPPPYEG